MCVIVLSKIKGGFILRERRGGGVVEEGLEQIWQTSE